MSYDESAVRGAFNRAAETFDDVAINNPINSWMREASRREIRSTFPSGSALVEIGCGTGADAVFLAEQGYRVAALDISERMVEIARVRVAAHDLEESVVVRRGRLIELEDVLSEEPWSPFDGAYANFSLGYEESIREIGATLSRLIKPGARFVFTLPNRLCISEPSLALARLRIPEVFGRLSESWVVTLRGSSVRVHAYTPIQVRRILAGLFEIEATTGVPVFMPPPSYYDPSFEWVRACLERLDNHLSPRFPWRILGETTMFRARKVAE